MRRILITGSRDWEDQAQIFSTLYNIRRAWGEDITIVHGGARGADSIAGAWTTFAGITEEVHHADWNTLGKRAGYVRNAEMVKAGADICLAFIRNESRGATMCADLAEKAGIPTHRFLA